MAGSPYCWRWQVPPTDSSDPLRADLVILRAIQEDPSWSQATPSRSQLGRWISEGHLTINGKATRPNHKLKEGDQIVVTVPAAQPSQVSAENLPIDILFEDSHLLVVNKAQGMSVHPSEAEQSGTLVNALLHHITDLSGIGGIERPGIVHRLDKMTSGALVVAKHDECHQKLSELFSRHELTRCYWALCYASPFKDSAQTLEVTGLMGRNPKDRKKMMLGTKEGRPSRSEFFLKESFQQDGQTPFASWIEAKIHTGRTHQIRVHLTHLGSSVLADPVYGAPSHRQKKWKDLPPEIIKQIKDPKQWPGQALHARLLSFTHPMTLKELRFEAPPPTNFQTLLQTLQKYR